MIIFSCSHFEMKLDDDSVIYIATTENALSQEGADMFCDILKTIWDVCIARSLRFRLLFDFTKSVPSNFIAVMKVVNFFIQAKRERTIDCVSCTGVCICGSARYIVDLVTDLYTPTNPLKVSDDINECLDFAKSIDLTNGITPTILSDCT